MKQTLQEYRFILLGLCIALVFVLLVSLVRVDYRVTAPGYNNEVDRFINLDIGYEAEGSFHTTSVIVLDEMTALQYFVGTREKRVQVSEHPAYYDNIDIGDLRIMGSYSKDDSLSKSLVVGIENALFDISYETHIMVYLTFTYLQEDTLELGDYIVTVNGNDPFTEIDAVGCEETATFVIERGDETLTYDVTKNYIDDTNCAFGLSVKTYTEIYSSAIDYALVKTSTGGPSGGLMQSLYIFNQLTPNDLTGGLKIAGTGTIDVDGSVGKIGGIEQKIITSALNGIDVFFVPYLSDSEYDNYIVAQQVLEGLNSDMVLVPVQNFSDAIDYLEGRFGGAFDEAS